MDHAATTEPHDDVITSMQPYLSDRYCNPSAIYATAEADALRDARAAVTDLLDATPENIVFTGGGSEADNLALKGAVEAVNGQHVVTTTIEHAAVIETCNWLENHDIEVTRVTPRQDGRVDPADIADSIRSDTALISIMHANNETGSVQPLEDIGEIADEHDILFHSDTVQSAGKVPIDVDAIGLDLASLSAHKFYGPKGVGALYVRDGVELEPLIHGGGQERRRRSGTENVPGIVGMGRAAELAMDDMAERRERLTELRDELVAILQNETDATLIGHPDQRLPGYAMMGFPGSAGADLVQAFADRDIAISSGSACHSGNQSPSRVLMEMGIDMNLAFGAVRFSLGRDTTSEDIQYVKDQLGHILEKVTT